MAEEIRAEDVISKDVVARFKQITAEAEETYTVLQKIKKSGQDSASAIKSATNVGNVKKEINALTESQKKLDKANKDVANSLAKENAELNKTSSGVAKVSSETNKLTGLLQKGGAAIVAFFAIDRIKEFIGGVIKVTSEFQKFSAVLTNTLGSKSAADMALKNIKDFAANTPFSVAELTESFVKLANSGFKPTMKELTRLGDLASSQGKSFNQLTEAIIDAQTGEFERLKEFGIRAQKEGDKVSFTFKGVKQQVDFTSDSIQNYILALGDAEGVSGGMAAISKTLGGQISNLGDSWDTFLATLGEGNSGALGGAVSLLDKALKIATDLVKTQEQNNKETIDTLSAAAFERYKSFVDEKQQLEFKDKIYGRILQLQIDIANAQANPKTASIPLYNKNVQELAALNNTISLILNMNEELKKSAAKDTGPKLNKYLDEINARKAQQMAEYKEDQAYNKKRKEDGEKAVQELSDMYEQFRMANSEDIGLAIENEIEAEEGLTDFELEELKKRVKANKEAEEQKAYDRKKLIDESIQYAGMAIQLYYDNLHNQYDRDTEALEAKRDYELKLAGDNKDAQNAINKKFDAEDKRLKTEQAKRDKQAALFAIVLNTARGVTAALASIPPNVPLSLFIGGFGLAQLGLAAGLNLPAFEKGTDSAPGGLAIVGEKGSELVIDPNGNLTLTPDHASIMDIPKRSQILAADETMRALALSGMEDMGGRQSTDKLDVLSKQLNVLNESIKRKESVSVNVTARGIEVMVQKGNRKTYYLKNYYNA